MKRRSVFAGLAIVAVVAVAVPAVAQDLQGANPLATNIKRVGDEARNLAHKAIKKANKALRKSRKATQLAIAASGKGTPGATGPAGPAGIGNVPAFSQAAAAVSTPDETQYVELPAGNSQPSVTVTVPQASTAPAGTGFIQVAAQAFIDEDAGGVALFEDDAPMPTIQNEICEQSMFGNPGPPLFTSPDSPPGFGGATWSTPAPLNSTFSCANSGPAAPVIVITTPGTHTYELRYAYCGCNPGNSATFSERKLWVTPLG